MAAIPGMTPGWYVPGQAPKGTYLNTPRNNSLPGAPQYYDERYATVRPDPQINQQLNGMNTTARGYNGVKPGGGQTTSTTTSRPVTPAASPAMKPATQTAQSTSLFPSMPKTDLFGSLFGQQSNQPQYQTSQNTGSPMVPGYTDNWGRPINGRPAGTTPVFGDDGVWTGNWQMAGTPASTPKYMPWSGPGKAQAAATAAANGTGTSGTTGVGGTTGSIGGGIQGGNITNNDLGYASWLIGGSGQMPMGMAQDAQREVRQTSQDVARQEAETANLDINRRGAYEQTRMDLARQMADAESSLGYGGLAARLYELMNQRDATMEGYGYDLASSFM